MINRGKILALAIMLAVFSGCATSNPLPYFSAQADAFEKEADFVELTNGEIILGSIAKDNIGNRKGYLILNETKYNYKEISSYQKDKRYFKKDQYNDFNERIVKGNINVYRSERGGQTTNGHGKTSSYSYTVFFLQKGDAGIITEVRYVVSEFKKMIQDYQPALDEYNKYEALSSKQKKSLGNNYMSNIISIYNRK